uniref:Fibronectin type-III domain-containing protein n=1 Tax=Heterorhabditis bacteriophora TaxID=37862 RepID=A0A1I7WWM5_HETBA
MRLQPFLLLLFFFYVALFITTAESNLPPVYLNATIDNTLSIDVYVSKVTNSHISSSVTALNMESSSSQGFKIYFTKDASLSSERFKEWQEIELLSSAHSYHIKLDGQDFHIKPDTIYRIRATVLINHVESLPSKVVYINTKDAAPKAPVIQSTKVLINSSVIIQFVPGEDIDVVTNYTLEYREQLNTSTTWTTLQFESDAANRVVLVDLRPNTTYVVRMFVSGDAVLGQISKEAVFSTNNTGTHNFVSTECVINIAAVRRVE